MRVTPIKVPFPSAFGSGKPTICYAVKDDQILLIDAGWDGPENRVALKKALETIDAWPPETILLTHGHIDHFGLAGFIQSQTGAELMIHKGDAQMLSNYETGLIGWYDKMMATAVGSGFGAEELENARSKLLMASRAMSKPSDFTEFEELNIKLKSGTIKSLSLPGHTPGSVAYVISEEAFCGDAAIEHTVHLQDLRQEFSSLQKLKVFKNVYPGHDRFPLKREDIEALESHFMNRLEDVIKICSKGATLKEVVEALYFGVSAQKNVVRMILPINQAITYLKYLEDEGAIGKKGDKWISFRDRL